MLHPTVESALSLDLSQVEEPGAVILEQEHLASEAFNALRSGVAGTTGLLRPVAAESLRIRS